MKPHLPLALLAALMLAAPARAIEIPAEYDEIEVWAASYLDDHDVNSSTDYKAFILGTDVSCTPTSNTKWTSSTPLMSGGNLIFTTAEDTTPAVLTFKNGASSAFEQPTSLTFDTLSKLELSNNSRGYDGAAIYLGTSGTLQISNVETVATDDTDAVLFSGNTVSVSASGTRSGGAIYAGASSSISVSNNGGVAFRTNTCTTTSDSSAARGGAVYSGGTIQMKGNSAVTFQGNKAKKTALRQFL